MVLKTEVCRFSGLKIYPGHGTRLTKMDSQTYLFLNAGTREKKPKKKRARQKIQAGIESMVVVAVAVNRPDYERVLQLTG